MRRFSQRLAFVLLTAASAAQAQERLALAGGMLLDGYERAPIHHAAVLIEGERIVAVGPADEVEIPPGTRVVDTRGRTMLPGLIDLHMHYDLIGHGNYEFLWEVDGRLVQAMEIAARQTLEAGVTTALDLGATFELLEVRERVRRGEIPGPRILTSGPWITRIAMDTVPPETQNVITSPEEAARKTRELIDAGVDVIKLWEGLTADDYKAVVAAAHERGIRVHAHLYEPEPIRMALDAGVDVHRPTLRRSAARRRAERLEAPLEPVASADRAISWSSSTATSPARLLRSSTSGTRSLGANRRTTSGG